VGVYLCVYVHESWSSRSTSGWRLCVVCMPEQKQSRIRDGAKEANDFGPLRIDERKCLEENGREAREHDLRESCRTQEWKKRGWRRRVSSFHIPPGFPMMSSSLSVLGLLDDMVSVWSSWWSGNLWPVLFGLTGVACIFSPQDPVD